MEKVVNYILVFLLIFICGSPVFESKLIPIVTLILVIAVLGIRKTPIPKDFLKSITIFLVAMLVLFIIHYFLLSSVSILADGYFLAKTMLGAAILILLKDEFKNYYFKCMFIISIVSLFFYALGYLWNVHLDFMNMERYNSIIIYNEINVDVGEEISDMRRNCGIFWEPGAFACYILLVFMLFVDDVKTLWSHKFMLFTIVLALLTTMSTTGYLGLGILIMLYFAFNFRIIYIPVIILMLFVSYRVYDSSSFMKAKITEQTQGAVNSQGDFSTTRMGSLLFDMHYIKKHPVIGNGFDVRSRYSEDLWIVNSWKENEAFSGNGFSDIIAKLGLYFMALYFFLFARSNRGLNFKVWITFCVVWLVAMQGEMLMNYPLFEALPFFSFSYQKWHDATSEEECLEEVPE